jgi:hypothetical protein
VFLSINFFLVSVCTLPYLSIFHAFGVLVVTVEGMIIDVALWGGLFVTMAFGFFGTLIGNKLFDS